jgi:NAD kinase
MYRLIILFCIKTHKLVVYVEESEYENELVKNDEQLNKIRTVDPNNKNEKQMLRKYTKNNSDPFGDRNKIDLLVCLGGDGTLLHASTLFQVNIF